MRGRGAGGRPDERIRRRWSGRRQRHPCEELRLGTVALAGLAPRMSGEVRTVRGGICRGDGTLCEVAEDRGKAPAFFAGLPAGPSLAFTRLVTQRASLEVSHAAQRLASSR